jgi:hypothetical protein
MTVTAPSRRPSVAARRVGYAIAMAVNLVLLYFVNVRPGWSALPVLTEDTTAVLGIFNASLIVGVAVNAAYAVYDARWFKALGDAVTAGIGLVVAIRIWQVFPFDFGESTVNWALLARFVLVVGIVGCAIGLVANVVSLLRVAATSSRS